MQKVDFDNLFTSIREIKVGVVGDIMLDTYWWGHVDRISPEAPVPVVALDKKENRLGGAANVALNAKSLGSRVYMLSVVGDDEAGAEMLTLLKTHDISTDYLVKDKDRITTTKTRVISRNQQMLRLDYEVTHDLSEALAEVFIRHFQSFIEREKPQVVILEDYNKGVMTSRVIESIIAICKSNHVLIAVDPKKHNFFAYQGVDIFKPNLKEVRDALNISIDVVDKKHMQKVHQLLQEKLAHQISFITLSEKGVFYQDGEVASLIPTHVRSIADVSGAGDTVIATASVVYALTRDPSLMAGIANIAGGLVCEEVGTVSINRDRLLEECKMAFE